MAFEQTIDRHSRDFLRRTVTLTLEKGKPVKSVDDNVPTRGSVQTVSGKERENLPEADRTKQSIKVYTQDTLEIDDVLFNIPGFPGEFLVRTREYWLEYIKVIAVKQ